MHPRNADERDLELAPERRLRRDYVCINSVFGSPKMAPLAELAPFSGATMC